MYKTLSTFLEKVNPLTVFAHYGLDVSKNGGEVMTHKLQPCFVRGSAIIPVNRGLGSFPVNILSFMSLILQDVDMYRVVETILDKLHLKDTIAGEGRVDDFIYRLVNEHEQHTTAVRLLASLYSAETSSYMAEAKTLVRNLGWNYEAFAGEVLLLTKPLIASYNGLTQKLGFPDKRIPSTGGPYLIIPFWKSHAQLSSWLVLRIKDMSAIHAVQLAPARFAITGLPHICPSQFTFLTDDPAVMFAYRKPGVHTVVHDSTAPDIGFLPDNLAYIHNKKRPLHIPTAISKVNGVTLYAAEKFKKPEVWELYLQQRWTEIVNTGDDVDATLFLSTTELSPTLKQWFKKYAVDSGFRFYNRIKDILEKTGEVVFEDWKFWSSASGMFYQKKNQVETIISNFYFDLRNTVVFPGREGEFFYGGYCMFDDTAYPILLSKEHTNKLDTLETAARAAWIRGAGQKEGSSFPALFERSRNTSTMLQRVFSHLSARLPIVTGIPYLGWSVGRDYLYGGSWTMDNQGLHTTHTYRDETLDVFNYYDKQLKHLPEPVDYTEQLRTPICDIISQLIGTLARGYLNYTIKPLKFINDENSRGFFKRLFGMIGQASDVAVNPNGRAVSDVMGIKGFPFYASGYTPSMLSKSTAPVFALGDEGISIPKLTEEDLDYVCKLFSYIFFSVGQWLINTQAQECKRYRGVLYSYELIMEGETIIRKVLDLASWPATSQDYTVVETFLKQEEANTLQLFAYDFSNQTVKITVPEKYELDGLVAQWKSLSKLTKVDKRVIQVDALSANQVLENYYGKMPEVTIVTPTAGLTGNYVSQQV
jgi:hypothetical protein